MKFLMEDKDDAGCRLCGTKGEIPEAWLDESGLVACPASRDTRTVCFCNKLKRWSA